MSEVANPIGVSRTAVFAIKKRVDESVNRRAGSGRKTVVDIDSLRDLIYETLINWSIVDQSDETSPGSNSDWFVSVTYCDVSLLCLVYALAYEQIRARAKKFSFWQERTSFIA